MVSRPYERIISKVAADVSLNNLPSDAIARDKIFVLALARVITMASSHYVQGKPAEIRSSTRENGHKVIRGIRIVAGPKWEKTVEQSFGLLIEEENRSIRRCPRIQGQANNG